MTSDSCATCGMALAHPAEFHPHLLCLLKRAYPERDPWRDFAFAVQLLLEIDLPARPPLVRHTPLKVRPRDRAEPDASDS